MSAAAADATPRHRLRWPSIALAIAFGLFYAYDVWEAVGNLVGLYVNFAEPLDTTFTAVGWIVLIGAIVLPIALFVVAFALGRRHGLPLQAAFYAIGLGVSAAWTLDLLAVFGPGNVLA